MLNILLALQLLDLFSVFDSKLFLQQKFVLILFQNFKIQKRH